MNLSKITNKEKWSTNGKYLLGWRGIFKITIWPNLNCSHSTFEPAWEVRIRTYWNIHILYGTWKAEAGWREIFQGCIFSIVTQLPIASMKVQIFHTLSYPPTSCSSNSHSGWNSNRIRKLFHWIAGLINLRWSSSFFFKMNIRLEVGIPHQPPLWVLMSAALPAEFHIKL